VIVVVVVVVVEEEEEGSVVVVAEDEAFTEKVRASCHGDLRTVGRGPVRQGHRTRHRVRHSLSRSPDARSELAVIITTSLFTPLTPCEHSP
jgi:hypothetical protein